MKKWMRPWLIIPLTCALILFYWSLEGVSLTESPIKQIGTSFSKVAEEKIVLASNEYEDIFTPVMDHNFYSEVDIKGNEALDIAKNYLQERSRMKDDKTLSLELGKYSSPALGLQDRLVWKITMGEKSILPIEIEPTQVEAEGNTPHANTDSSWLLVDCKSGNVLTLFTAGD